MPRGRPRKTEVPKSVAAADDTKVEVEVLPGHQIWEAKHRYFGAMRHGEQGDRFITTFKRAQSLSVRVIRSLQDEMPEPGERGYEGGFNRLLRDEVGFNRSSEG